MKGIPICLHTTYTCVPVQQYQPLRRPKWLQTRPIKMSPNSQLKLLYWNFATYVLVQSELSFSFLSCCIQSLISWPLERNEVRWCNMPTKLLHIPIILTKVTHWSNKDLKCHCPSSPKVCHLEASTLSKTVSIFNNLWEVRTRFSPVLNCITMFQKQDQ